VFVTRKIEGFDEFEQFFTHADIELIKLSKGILSSAIKMVSFSDVTVFDVTSTNTFFSQGGMKEGKVTFILLKEFLPTFRQLGKEIAPYTVMINTPGSECATKSTMKLYNITMNLSFIKQFLYEHNIEHLLELLYKHRRIVLNQIHYYEIVSLLQMVFFLYNENTNGYEAIIKHKLQVELPFLLFEAMKVQTKQFSLSALQSFNQSLFMQSVNLLTKKSLKHVNVASVSRALNRTDRTLRLAFQSEIGMTPHEFFKAYKMSQSYRKLQHRLHYSVASIATDVGFNNGGHFSKEFYHFFERMPSQL